MDQNQIVAPAIQCNTPLSLDESHILRRRKIELPRDKKMSITQLQSEIAEVKGQISFLKAALELPDDDSDDDFEMPPDWQLRLFDPPPHSIPIAADVRAFDFQKLAKTTQFDIITMDPPWVLSSSSPTRGVAISYSTLSDTEISDIPIPILQTDGFLGIWVINARFSYAVEQMEAWGYEIVDTITWAKMTVNRRLARGHGYWLQHAKETMIIGKKGNPRYNRKMALPDVIVSERRGQSQKPTEIYDFLETLCPNGKYLEIFCRKNNLRNYWISIGLEL